MFTQIHRKKKYLTLNSCIIRQYGINIKRRLRQEHFILYAGILLVMNIATFTISSSLQKKIPSYSTLNLLLGSSTLQNIKKTDFTEINHCLILKRLQERIAYTLQVQESNV